MSQTRWIVLGVAAVVFVAALMAGFVSLTPQGHALWVGMMSRKTIEQRLEEYGPAARGRLEPYFRDAGVNYPPAAVTLVAFKRDKVLEVYANNSGEAPQLIRSYPVLGASGELGPKLRAGDMQVPEGAYAIESLNPNSRFHLALRVSYPNTFDRLQAINDGRTDLGGDIMIHGDSRSVGCLAMGDEAIEEIFTLAAQVGVGNTRLIIAPQDLREDYPTPDEIAHLPAWTGELYNLLRNELFALPPRETPSAPDELPAEAPDESPPPTPDAP